MRCGCGSAVSGRVLPGSGARSGLATAVKKEDAGRGRARVCGIGAAWAVLHIRPGPAGGGSAESCGNVPVFNTGEILPCAERPALHMGARPLETEVLARVPESCGKLEVDPRGRPSPMCNTTARAERSSSREAPLPSDEAAFPRLAREDPDSPGSGPPPGPRREFGPARTPRETAPTAPAPVSGPPLLARKARRPQMLPGTFEQTIAIGPAPPHSCRPE